MVEPEPAEALSARKLVVETGKYNVITAYSGEEAVELLRIFPKVSAVILHSEIRDVGCGTLLAEAKTSASDLPVILLTTRDGCSVNGADYSVPSQSPEELVELLRNVFGDPRVTKSKPPQAPAVSPRGMESRT
jgi:DNA-binding response OmpR family regulator